MSLDWNFRGADIIAIGLGAVAIGIAIAIFIVQKRTSKNIESMRSTAISISLARVQSMINVIRESVISCMEIVKIKGANEGAERQVAIAKIAMENEKKVYFNTIENITKEADFLKGQIDSMIHLRIEYIVNAAKRFSKELSPIHDSNLEALREWNDTGQDIVKEADELIAELFKK